MALSGYRILWMLVMFDLPVGLKKERKAATAFRNHLLDEGFEMAQFSVYMRFCASKDKTTALVRRIEQNLPRGGKVDILTFTDKQYENIIGFRGTSREPAKKNPSQYVMF